MAGTRVLKRTRLKDSDWLFLHRDPNGYGSPRINDGRVIEYGVTVRDFLSDIPTNPVTDTDCPNSGVENTLLRPVAYEAGSPVVADVDRIVASVVMFVGDYTIANATPEGGVALNVTVTNSTNTVFDTPGTIEILGTDIDDQPITDSIIPATNATVQGTRAFKTIVSVTGVGWVTDGDDDDIEVGFGEWIGIPDYMPQDRVLFATLTNTREAVHPTVTSSATVLSANTVDLSTALGGTAVVIYYLV